MVPIRYGRKSKRRGNTYTMVFAQSCSQTGKLGKGLVIPARAECCKPEDLFEEAEQLWAAERDVEEIDGFCGTWGKVCILKNPKVDDREAILMAWQSRIAELGEKYNTAFPTATGEPQLFNPASGVALIDWPKAVATNQHLLGFDLLLMTATKPDVNGGRYPTATEIADAWRTDPNSNVLYFYNNRHYGITTFEDDVIQAALRGEPPDAIPTPH